MRKIVPPDAVLIPAFASKVYKGSLFSVYQWAQKTGEGTVERLEMVRRPDSAFVLAVRDDKVVVLKESRPGTKEHMTLPGGRVEAGEDPMQAAARELAEETGLVFRKYRLVSVMQPSDKIEWFVYLYIATEYQDAVLPQLETGEQIAMAYMDYSELVMRARHNHRLGSELVLQHLTLESLLAAPTYQGMALDSEL